ncbi:MAG TPA: TerB family tellurite resistance protein [Bauldia sp.]|nr:TerB family tellurite resistance protein [Bauldia sp.]
MIAAIRQFFADLAGKDEPRRFTDDDFRLAAAALLFHAIGIDGVVSADERRRLAALLQTRFGLSAEETEELMEAAEAADREAVDLYGFTSVLKRRLDEAERERVIAMMWEVAYADGAVHEFEDNLIWRAAELLAVPARARIRLKQAARDNATE